MRSLLAAALISITTIIAAAMAADHAYDLNQNDLKQKTLDAFIPIKNLYLYNLVNATAACIGEMTRTKKPGETASELMAGVDKCSKGWEDRWNIMMTITKDYRGLTVQCELEARLFERELLLPPYDFLKGHGIILLDPGVAVQCLRAERRARVGNVTPLVAAAAAPNDSLRCGTRHAASVASSLGSTIDGSSFSGLLTRVDIGHMRIRSAGNGLVGSPGSGSSPSPRV
jgi:hypothetical protein